MKYPIRVSSFFFPFPCSATSLSRGSPSVLRHWKEDVAKADVFATDFRVLTPLVGVLKLGSLESRIAAAWVVEAMAAVSAEAKPQIAEVEGMLTELLRLVADGEGEKPTEPRAIVAGLAALAALSSLRRVRLRIVALGAVPALARLLAWPSSPLAVVESALQLMEAASTCTKGRAAICADPPR
ncbi:hypothetical protein Taro_023390 [Colocasia esculenta]|uniref:U-box domain-containing protein n=1 Tax=Colocasia esculenta TaxID=4460 RepID=A0A843V4I8_COLES|nr:hypothetical protein [Colocasia esculenta]